MSKNDSICAPFELPQCFWDHVDKSGDCWLWTGTLYAAGYGHACFKSRHWGAHRLMMASLGYEISGLVVRHTCDVPACVNPAHLLVGTNQDNMDDMVKRGRSNKRFQCETHPNAKITNEQARAICDEYASAPRYPKSGMIVRGYIPKLVAKYGISEITVRAIVSGRRWCRATGGQHLVTRKSAKRSQPEPMSRGE